MKIELEIPKYEDWLEGFWEDGALGELELGEKEIVLKCNREALLSLGKQCLYLYRNYDGLPVGSHICFNPSYFPGAKGWQGKHRQYFALRSAL